MEHALAHQAPNGVLGQKQDRYFSRAVGKALEAMEILTRQPAPLPLGQIAKSLGLTKTSAFRILHTLEQTGSICRSPDGSYLLAPERLTGSSRLVNMLVRGAEEPMKELCRKFGETVSLAVLFDNHIEVVAIVESPHVLKMGNIVGRIIPPHASSLGKAITAFQSEAVREKLLRCYGMFRFTPTTITDELELTKEFETTRRRGYAIDNEESTPGGCCFGAPVYGMGHKVSAALSISVPAGRLKHHDPDNLIKEVRKTAGMVSFTGERLRAPLKASLPANKNHAGFNE